MSAAGVWKEALIEHVLPKDMMQLASLRQMAHMIEEGSEAEQDLNKAHTSVRQAPLTPAQAESGIQPRLEKRLTIMLLGSLVFGAGWLPVVSRIHQRGRQSACAGHSRLQDSF